MKRIPAKEWVLWILLALLSLGLWYKFTYPQFSFLNLSVDRDQALTKAQEYLSSRGIIPQGYIKAIVFNVDNWADRYLQRAAGEKGEKEFIEKNNYNLFTWQVRFCKQFQKEEYILEISPRDAQVLSMTHLIDDVTAAPDIGKENARRLAEDFLRQTYEIDFNDYDFHEENVTRYERRVDYGFSWEKKGVYIPWTADSGGAKLIIGATVTGDGVRKFFKESIDIPEKFYRHIENQLISGEYLYTFYFIMLVFLISAAIFVVAKNRSSAPVQLSWRWYFFLFVGVFLLNIGVLFNSFQEIKIEYITSASFASFLAIYLLRGIISLTAISIKIIPTGMGGEFLTREIFPGKKYISFSHYLKSSFLSRPVGRAILLGYLAFTMALGLQAVSFYFGERYLGVWKEWITFTQFSSAYAPFLSAFTIAITASVIEEVSFRLFGISWARRYFKNTAIAVIFTSLIWGFGHSFYAVFPVWFRGIEVSIMGLLFGFVYLRYGLIAVIVAHYLFDAFWISSAYILGHSTPYLYCGSLFIILLPLIWAAAAYLMNKPDRETAAKLLLNETQKYNLEVLKSFVLVKKGQGLSAEVVSRELTGHGWDPDLAALAVREIFGKEQKA